MGFGDRWKTWIYRCISTASILVLVNGVPTEEIPMAKGLRQGCSLSPLLFNLVGELLNLLLTKAVNLGLFNGFRIGTSEKSFLLSHLQFTDDLIIFCSATGPQIKKFRRVLRIFELVTGLKINGGKSKLMGINVDESDLKEWAASIGCKTGIFPSEYMGLPLGAKRNSVTLWDPVIEKVQGKLSGWKAASLSAAGRLVMILVGWWEECEQNTLDQLGYGMSANRKRGLGIPDLKIMNRALLGKWIWKFGVERDTWWKKIVCSRYNKEKEALTISNLNNHSASWIWRGVVSNFTKEDDVGGCLQSHMQFKIGRGMQSHFGMITGYTMFR
ncbi:hypothetical protein HRI_003198800 [Hibiscus trionum]|uniref:Reverse transcriptase domain-containing protein n=1 Tax=Hibiscus trionum TaxID=183268 RepID=A0A9W7IFF2_HIBTR|nr:hypothetical protein HRI_003198800 [Hibiscus trionum]